MKKILALSCLMISSSTFAAGGVGISQPNLAGEIMCNFDRTRCEVPILFQGAVDEKSGQVRITADIYPVREELKILNSRTELGTFEFNDKGETPHTATLHVTAETAIGCFVVYYTANYNGHTNRTSAVYTTSGRSDCL